MNSPAPQGEDSCGAGSVIECLSRLSSCLAQVLDTYGVVALNGGRELEVRAISTDVFLYTC